MRLLRWLPGRLLSAVVVLLGASALIFIALRSIPGDFARLILGPLATEEMRQQVRETFGLDRSLPEQFLLWLGAAGRGDLGVSLATGVPILDEFSTRLPVTALLATMALLLAIGIGLPLGLATGTRAGSGRGSTVGRLVSGIGISIPDFVLACVIVFLFSRFSLGISVGSFVSPLDDFWGGLRSLFLPAVTLALFCIAATARITRSAVLGVLVDPHISAAVARGESKRFIVRHHVLRNALIPVMTLTATLAAYLLGGAVIVENIFNVPGFGSYLFAALGRRDYTVIQAGVLLVTTIFVVASFVIDLATGLIDPRVSALRKGRTS
jgi:peptide/nickel transport system permease protein